MLIMAKISKTFFLFQTIFYATSVKRINVLTFLPEFLAKREKCVVVMNHHVLFFQVEKFSFIIKKSANQAKNLYSRPFIRVGGTGGN